MEEMLGDKARDLYARLMGEVKCRLDDVFRMGAMESFLCPMTRIEFAGLQFRQIFETIAWACMVANGEPLKPELLLPRHERNPRFLFSYLADAVMPDCYPTPLIRVPVDDDSTTSVFGDDVEGFVGELAKLAEDEWLSRPELVRLHGELSRLLHIRNPMRGVALHGEFYEKMIPVWWEKTANLVALHRIALPGDDLCVVRILASGQVIIDDFYKVGFLGGDRDLMVSRRRTKRFS